MQASMSSDPSHSANPTQEGQEEVLPPPHERYQQIISTLPFLEGLSPLSLRNYHGFWFPELYLRGLIAFQHRFTPRPTDIFLISQPKSGTTWLKALIFAIVTRKIKDHPSHLLTQNPHDCIPFVEHIYNSNQASKLDDLPSPRLLASHSPYSLLPESMTSSNCRIVYLCRDPKDHFVSLWHFHKAFTLPNSKELLPLQETFEMYCNGIGSMGPIWDHVLGYWKETLKRPEKLFFLKYEEMMEDPEGNVRKLAEFVGHPFSEEEEGEGVVEEIVSLCSFVNLSGLEVNKTGVRRQKDVVILKNASFFRKGKVGDWKNHLTVEMAKRLDGIIEEKLRGSGLSLGCNVVGLQISDGDDDSSILA